jgi:type IV secretion system protein VirB3
MDGEYTKPEFHSYNGLGRKAMVPKLGVPYMAGLTIFVVAILGSTLMAVAMESPAGYLAGTLAAPLLIYIKEICRTDDRAVEIVLIETRWVLTRLSSGTARYFGGTFTFSPVAYGRRFKDAQKYFEAHPRG